MVLALVVAACQPAATATPTPRPTEPPTEVPVEEEDEPTEVAAGEDEPADDEDATEEADEIVEGDTTEEADMMAEGDETEEAVATEDLVELDATVEVAAVIEVEATEIVEIAATEIVEIMETEIVTVEATEIIEVIETEIVEVPATEIVDVIETEIVEIEATVLVEGVIEGDTVVSIASETPTPAPMITEVVEVTDVAVTEVVIEVTEVEVTEVVVMATATPGAQVEGEVSGDVITIESGDSVVVGLAAGLSGEGIAPLGVDIQRGAEIAIARRGTVTVDGEEFEVVLDSQDDLCSAEGGQAVANRFVSNSDVVGVVGPMCSSACRAAIPIFDSAGFTTISPSCTAADLTATGSTSFNRSVVSDSFQGRVAADFIYNVLGITSIATIHDGSTYGEGLVTVLTERFQELGGEVVAADAVSVGETDFRGLLEDMAQDEPELIYFGGFPAEAARLAIQRADANLDDVAFMGADGILGTEYVELAGSDAEGTYATATLPSATEAFQEFLAEYEETYGEEPPAPYHGTAYDAVNVFLDAVEAVGTVEDGNLVIDRAALSEYVRSVSDFQGITGVLNADGTGEMSFSDIGISQVTDGVFSRIYIGSVEDGEVVLTEATEEAAGEEAADEEATEEAAADAEASEDEADSEAVEPEAEATEAS